MSRTFLVVTAIVCALLLVFAFVAGGYSAQKLAASGLNMPQACTPDAFEPNNTVGTAVTLTAGYYTNLSICAIDDHDYFRVTVPTGYRVSAELIHERAAGDLDLELIDGDGLTLLAVSDTINNVESVNGYPLSFNLIYLHVLGDMGDISNDYSLNLRLWCEQCITYQGQLRDASGPLNGTYEFYFQLFRAPVGDEWLGVPYTNTYDVVDGLLTAQLDFGPLPELFSGGQRYLEIGVRPSGTPTYTLLLPRQALSPAPAAHSAPWVGLSGVPSSLLDGDQGWPERALPPQANATSGHDNDPTFWRRDEVSSVTIGADGFPIIAFNDDAAVFFVHCQDSYCQSSSITEIESDGQWPSVALGVDGLPVVSYYYTATADLKMAHCNDLECLNTSIVTVDRNGDAGKFPSITIGADGNPFISYVARNVLHAAHCLDTSCTTAVTKTISTLVQGNSQGETAVTMLRNGHPFIAYAFVPYLIGIYCQDLDCNQYIDDLLYPATLLFYLGGLDVTMAADGWPIVSWYYSFMGARSLMITHCPLQTACTHTGVDGFFSNDTTLDSGITIGRDGLPIISYFYDDYDPDPGELRAAFCQTISCSQTITMTLESDSMGYEVAGKANAVTIGTDESPFFSYIGYVNGQGTVLKTLHCANSFCVPYLRRR